MLLSYSANLLLLKANTDVACICLLQVRCRQLWSSILIVDKAATWPVQSRRQSWTLSRNRAGWPEINTSMNNWSSKLKRRGKPCCLCSCRFWMIALVSLQISSHRWKDFRDILCPKKRWRPWWLASNSNKPWKVEAERNIGEEIVHHCQVGTVLWKAETNRLK